MSKVALSSSNLSIWGLPVPSVLKKSIGIGERLRGTEDLFRVAGGVERSIDSPGVEKDRR